MKIVSIETKRLTIREFETSDWEAVHSYAKDKEVRGKWRDTYVLELT